MIEPAHSTTAVATVSFFALADVFPPWLVFAAACITGAVCATIRAQTQGNKIKGVYVFIMALGSGAFLPGGVTEAIYLWKGIQLHAAAAAIAFLIATFHDNVLAAFPRLINGMISAGLRLMGRS